MRERGIGVIGFEPGPLLAGRAVDTLDVRAEPTSGAAVIARLVLDTAGVYRDEARAGLLEEQGTLEFGYEVVGIVLLERGPAGWVRAPTTQKRITPSVRRCLPVNDGPSEGAESTLPESLGPPSMKYATNATSRCAIILVNQTLPS
jgi:hypothetical protein